MYLSRSPPSGFGLMERVLSLGQVLLLVAVEILCVHLNFFRSVFGQIRFHERFVEDGFSIIVVVIVIVFV